MTGRSADETIDIPLENHSDAESLRHIPADYMDRGVVQDSPGNSDTGSETLSDPNQEKNAVEDGVNGGTLDDDLTARD